MFRCVIGSEASGDLDELTRFERRVSKGVTLFRNGDTLGAIYAVRRGSFKTAILSPGGNEQVTGLHLPGEIMGLEAVNGGRHTCEAVALQESEVSVISFARLSELAQRNPALQRELLRVMSVGITRDQGLMLLMGAMSAEQRICAFLLNLSRRNEALGRSATHLSLHMTRHDLASYVGLSPETVSRVLTRIQYEGLIAARPREIELKDVALLHEKAGSW